MSYAALSFYGAFLKAWKPEWKLGDLRSRLPQPAFRTGRFAISLVGEIPTHGAKVGDQRGREREVGMTDAGRTIQTAIEIVGKLRDASDATQESQFNKHIAELSEQLSAARLHAAQMHSDLASLREENADMKGRLEFRERGKPRVVDETYQFEGEEGSFCTACFDVHQRKVRLRKLTGDWAVFGNLEYPACKATYG